MSNIWHWEFTSSLLVWCRYFTYSRFGEVLLFLCLIKLVVARLLNYEIDSRFNSGACESYCGEDWTSRTRFAAEIITAIRKAVGPDFPISLRISQWKTSFYGAKLAETPEQLAAFLEPLTAAGVDIYHCSTRRFWEPEFEGSDLNLAGWVRSLTGKPTITVGSVGLSEEFMSSLAPGKVTQTVGLEGLIDKLVRNEFDLVAVGRSLLADPEWVVKVKGGRLDELKPFIADALGTLI